MHATQPPWGRIREDCVNYRKKELYKKGTPYRGEMPCLPLPTVPESLGLLIHIVVGLKHDGWSLLGICEIERKAIGYGAQYIVELAAPT